MMKMTERTGAKPQAFTLMEAIMESNLPGPARHIYMVIVKRTNSETGEAFPSYPRLAQDTGYSEKTCERHVATLVEHGWLTVEKVKGKSNHYTVSAGRNHRLSDGGTDHRLSVRGDDHRLSDGGTTDTESVHHRLSDGGVQTESLSNGKPNGKENGQENGKGAAQPPVETQKKKIEPPTTSSDSKNTSHPSLTLKENHRPSSDSPKSKSSAPEDLKGSAKAAAVVKKTTAAALIKKEEDPDRLYQNTLKELAGCDTALSMFMRRVANEGMNLRTLTIARRVALGQKKYQEELMEAS